MSAPASTLLWCPVCGTQTVDPEPMHCRNCRDVIGPEPEHEAPAVPRAEPTPGPWLAELKDGSDWRVTDEDGDWIARVYNPYSHLGDRDDLVLDAAPVTEATARQIAAAPDMADALEPFATAARQINPALPDDTIVRLQIGEATIYNVALGSLRAARAALAKARGPQ